MKRSPLPERTRLRAVELYASGLSLERIALALGLSYSRVRSALLRSGVPLRPQGGPKSVPLGVAAGLYAEGRSLADVAAQVGCCSTTVRRAVLLAGATLRARGSGQVRHRFTRDAEAVEMYSTGHSIDSVSQRLGCSPATVGKALRRAGVVMRKRGGRPRDARAEVRS